MRAAAVSIICWNDCFVQSVAELPRRSARRNSAVFPLKVRECVPATGPSRTATASTSFVLRH
jgi:hypothetical protein